MGVAAQQGVVNLDGVDYAETSAAAAAQFGPDVKDWHVRDWVRRSTKPTDRLYGVITPHRRRGRTYLSVAQVARAELLTRDSRHAGGRRRKLDIAMTPG